MRAYATRIYPRSFQESILLPDVGRVPCSLPLPLETLPTPPLNSIRPLRYCLYLLTACLVQGRIFMTFSSSDPPPPKSHEFHRSTPSRNTYIHTDVDIDRERERERIVGET